MVELFSEPETYGHSPEVYSAHHPVSHGSTKASSQFSTAQKDSKKESNYALVAPHPLLLREVGPRRTSAMDIDFSLLQPELAVVGVSHVDASLSVRGQISLDKGQIHSLQTQLSAEGVDECIILSTCNRTEIYTNTTFLSEVISVWAQEIGMDSALLQGHLFLLTGQEAARHLFRIATGLESALIGETEIIAQIRDALKSSQRMNLAGSDVGFTFQRALETSRRVRSKSGLAVGATSIITCSMRVLQAMPLEPAAAPVLVLGSGHLAEGILKALRRLRFQNVTVFGRNFERAQLLAERHGYQADHLAQFQARAQEAKVVFGAASNRLPILLPDEAKNLDLVIDLGLPSNFDATGYAEQLITLDELIEKNREEIKTSQTVFSLAADLIEEEVDRFKEGIAKRRAAAAVEALLAKSDQIKNKNLSWLYNNLGEVDEATAKVLDEFAKRFMIGMIEAPLRQLKTQFHTQEGQQLVARLFELDGQS